MSIRERITNVDLNNGRVNTDYRAALHDKLSAVKPDASSIKTLIAQDFTRPLDARTTELLHELRLQLLKLDSTRSYIALSPIGPFGIDALLTKTSSLKVAHVTGRSADVVADPTIQLAVEIYRQRLTGEKNDIALGTSHRCVRLQRYKDPSFTTTFEMFATIDSTVGQDKFYEEKRIACLIQFYSTFFENILPDADFKVSIGNIKIAEKFIHDIGDSTIEERFKKLQERLPDKFNHELSPENLYDAGTDSLSSDLQIGNEIRSMKRVFETLPQKLQSASSFPINRILGMGHYNGPVFMIHVNEVTMVDGGSVNWISTLTSNNKERAVVSGFGIELFAKLLRKE